MYLDAATKLEPLACGWRAWSLLIPPVQQAMNLAFRHVACFRNVQKYDVSEFRRRAPMRTRGADVPGADDGDFSSSHM